MSGRCIDTQEAALGRFTVRQFIFFNPGHPTHSFKGMFISPIVCTHSFIVLTLSLPNHIHPTKPRTTLSFLIKPETLPNLVDGT